MTRGWKVAAFVVLVAAVAFASVAAVLLLARSGKGPPVESEGGRAPTAGGVSLADYPREVIDLIEQLRPDPKEEAAKWLAAEKWETVPKAKFPGKLPSRISIPAKRLLADESVPLEARLDLLFWAGYWEYLTDEELEAWLDPSLPDRLGDPQHLLLLAVILDVQKGGFKFFDAPMVSRPATLDHRLEDAALAAANRACELEPDNGFYRMWAINLAKWPALRPVGHVSAEEYERSPRMHLPVARKLWPHFERFLDCRYVAELSAPPELVPLTTERYLASGAPSSGPGMGTGALTGFKSAFKECVRSAAYEGNWKKVADMVSCVEKLCLYEPPDLTAVLTALIAARMSIESAKEYGPSRLGSALSSQETRLDEVKEGITTSLKEMRTTSLKLAAKGKLVQARAKKSEMVQKLREKLLPIVREIRRTILAGGH